MAELRPAASDYPESSAPATPATGYVRLYAKADGLLYMKDDAGTETAMGGSTLPVTDSTAIVKGSADATKLVRIEADGITAGTTRVGTMPDADITFIGGSVAAGTVGTTDNVIVRTDGTGGNKVQGGSGVTLDDSANMRGIGTLQFIASTELTIASGAITKTQSYHRIDTESNAATDDLITINGGTTGDVLYIVAENAARTVVVKETDNIRLFDHKSIELNEDYKVLPLLFNGTNWHQVGGHKTLVSNSATFKFGANQTTTSGSLVDVDATNAAITIVQNGNGRAIVTMSARFLKNTGGSGYVAITNSLGTSDEREVTSAVGAEFISASYMFSTEPGSTTYKLQYRTSDASSFVLQAGLALQMTVLEIT